MQMHKSNDVRQAAFIRDLLAYEFRSYASTAQHHPRSFSYVNNVAKGCALGWIACVLLIAVIACLWGSLIWSRLDNRVDHGSFKVLGPCAHNSAWGHGSWLSLTLQRFSRSLFPLI